MWSVMWILIVLALLVGYGAGKIEAVIRMQRWLKNLSPWDQVTAKSLLKNGTRCDENVEFDKHSVTAP
jgi:hypothetical protein